MSYQLSLCVFYYPPSYMCVFTSHEKMSQKLRKTARNFFLFMKIYFYANAKKFKRDELNVDAKFNFFSLSLSFA